jgi:hypothetical protein
MPRAHAQVESIIQQVAIVRENIKALTQSLEQQVSASYIVNTPD